MSCSLESWRLNSTKPAMPAAMPMAPVEDTLLGTFGATCKLIYLLSCGFSFLQASGNIRDPMLDLLLGFKVSGFEILESTKCCEAEFIGLASCASEDVLVEHGRTIGAMLLCPVGKGF